MKAVVLAFSIVLVGVGSVCGDTLQVHYTTLDYPGGSGTMLAGIDGRNIIGTDYSLVGGFLYNGSTFTQIVFPSATGGTYPLGISGGTVVGSYQLSPSTTSAVTQGFLYNGSAYVTINDPLTGVGLYYGGTSVTGISGNKIVGTYWDSAEQPHGFLYNGSTYTTIDEPNAAPGAFLGTEVSGIYGNNIFGTYRDANAVFHGFIDNIYTGTFTTLDDPLAPSEVAGSAAGTFVTAVDGSNIIGGYYTAEPPQMHGFIYDGSTYTTIDDPHATVETYLTGISGNTVVGWYYDSSETHGFTATFIPEPSSLSLVGVAAAGLLAYRVRRRWKKRTAHT